MSHLTGPRHDVTVMWKLEQHYEGVTHEVNPIILFVSYLLREKLSEIFCIFKLAWAKLVFVSTIYTVSKTLPTMPMFKTQDNKIIKKIIW